ncbi:MAG: tRNA epoxyqueuosine(34) reductase QueG [Gammaproteobacteria bacterium]|nr:tRNA epoxyqueuosine(34) reductase QueG [Gammaproteobacteria bacterium]
MTTQDIDFTALAQDIRLWGEELGFQQVGICDTDLSDAEQHLMNWLDDGFHGDMDWMQRHGTRRSRPADLVKGTVRVISARMDYLPSDTTPPNEVLQNKHKAFVSRYALGGDYHKILRKRLQKLIDRVADTTGEFGYRVFTDSAPVLEKALAEKAGIGWIGKHSNLLNKKAGSWFFLGEIYTDLPLPIDQPATNHCGECNACITACPTDAIVAPYRVDAQRCISYLTIELKGSIPEELRPQMGNRIYGCDDCQLVCPWNRFAQSTHETVFASRHGLDNGDLVELFLWSKQEFDERMQGSAIRRIGYERWLRNIAVALGNARTSNEILNALRQRLDYPSKLVVEHVKWAISQHEPQANDQL